MSRDPDGPAARSDLRPGDLIVAVNDTPIDGMDALFRRVSRWPPNAPLALHIVRRTHQLTIELTPSELG
jgi:S1-C subfamily serine protease